MKISMIISRIDRHQSRNLAINLGFKNHILCLSHHFRWMLHMFLKLTNLPIERNKGRFKEQSNIDMKYVYQSDIDKISRILTIDI